MKAAYFLIVEHGIDGRSPENIVFASTNEVERDNWYNESQNQNYYQKVDRVYDLAEIAESAWKRLNGIERLSLLDTACPIWQANYPAFEDYSTGKVQARWEK